MLWYDFYPTDNPADNALYLLHYIAIVYLFLCHCCYNSANIVIFLNSNALIIFRDAEILRLAHFKPVHDHVIDTMHNLCSGR